MRSTYGNKLGGIPRSNILVPADETRYSTVLKPDGTRDKLTDWQLYFKKEEEGGLLPEYINDLVRSIPDGADSLNESGEFDFGNIMYSFRDIRLVPLHDEFNNRVTTQIAGYTIPDRWDLVADVYLYLKRDVVIESQGQSVITEYMSGILQPDLLLATGQLEYSLKPCSNGKTPCPFGTVPRIANGTILCTVPSIVTSCNILSRKVTDTPVFLDNCLNSSSDKDSISSTKNL